MSNIVNSPDVGRCAAESGGCQNNLPIRGCHVTRSRIVIFDYDKATNRHTLHFTFSWPRLLLLYALLEYFICNKVRLPSHALHCTALAHFNQLFPGLHIVNSNNIPTGWLSGGGNCCGVLVVLVVSVWVQKPRTCRCALCN